MSAPYANNSFISNRDNFKNLLATTQTNNGFTGSDLIGSTGSGVIGSTSDALVAYPCNLAWGVTQTLIIIVITALIILGNVTNIVVISRSLHTFSITGYFLISLACADLGVGLLITPLAIGASIYHEWTPLYGLPLCEAVGMVVAALCAVSIYSITLLTLDKYVYIVYPLRYPRLFTPPKAKGAIAVTWGVCIAYFVIHKVTWSTYYYDEKAYICSIDFPKQWDFTLFVIATIVLPPTLMIVYCNYKTFKVAQSHNLQIQDILRTINNITTQLQPSNGSQDNGDCGDADQISNHSNQTRYQGKTNNRSVNTKINNSASRAANRNRNGSSTRNAKSRIKHEKLPVAMEESVIGYHDNGCHGNKMAAANTSLPEINRKSSSASGSKPPTLKYRLSGQHRALKMNILIASAFFVAWIPYSVIQIIMSFSRVNISQPLIFTIQWIAFANSFWNSIIYYYFNKEYRSKAGKLYRKLCCVKGCVKRDIAEEHPSIGWDRIKCCFSETT